MGRELRIRVTGDRMPPQIEGLEVDDRRWRLALEPHGDLLRDVTGVDPDGELTLQDLVTIRARLEGYVEREKRPIGRIDEQPTDRERDRSLGALLGRLLERLRAIRSLVGRTADATGQQSDEPVYAAETVQGLAAVFRAAAAARRREIASGNTASATAVTRTTEATEITEPTGTAEPTETAESTAVSEPTETTEPTADRSVAD